MKKNVSGPKLTLQNTVSDVEVPSMYRFKKWVSTVLPHQAVALTIRIVDVAEIQQLNKDYRNKNKPTNVLSFPSESPDDSFWDDFLLNEPYLGDIVICAQVVCDEALQQEKAIIAHWAHLTLHGVLHLLGYDHENDEEAHVMETKEIALLAELGYPNPYV